MTVTKKQTSIAVFAVIFATAMIVGTLASATVDARQSISQSNSNHQESKCISSGGDFSSKRWTRWYFSRWNRWTH